MHRERCESLDGNLTRHLPQRDEANNEMKKGNEGKKKGLDEGQIEQRECERETYLTVGKLTG